MPVARLPRRRRATARCSTSTPTSSPTASPSRSTPKALVLVSDVPGVLRDVADPGSRIARLSVAEGRSAHRRRRRHRRDDPEARGVVRRDRRGRARASTSSAASSEATSRARSPTRAASAPCSRLRELQDRGGEKRRETNLAYGGGGDKSVSRRRLTCLRREGDLPCRSSAHFTRRSGTSAAWAAARTRSPARSTDTSRSPSRSPTASSAPLNGAAHARRERAPSSSDRRRP